MVEFLFWTICLSLYAVTISQSFLRLNFRWIWAQIRATNLLIVLKVYVYLRLLDMNCRWRDTNLVTNLMNTPDSCVVFLCLNGDFNCSFLSHWRLCFLSCLHNSDWSVWIILRLVRRWKLNLLTYISFTWLVELIFRSLSYCDVWLLLLFMRRFWLVQIMNCFYALIEVLKVLYALLVPHMIINLPCHLVVSWLIESLFTLFILLPLVCGGMLVWHILVQIYIVWHQLRDRWK